MAARLHNEPLHLTLSAVALCAARKALLQQVPKLKHTSNKSMWQSLEYCDQEMKHPAECRLITVI